ncbi:MAG: aminoglycoside 3'-phosphotransferase/choline kinase family protein [Rickettsiales bacterium]|jgi:aminoglycoside phosphotransferase (APT) family kinase protein|nr:aminoglycoside 3'-phosphotransferase/choline kinase family protein [Rickettsiales bacterium]
MLRFFFELGDFLTRIIPGRGIRAWVRRTQLYDYRKKLDCLKSAFPDLNFRNMNVVKGGWNIGFIVDHKYVFKIRKAYDDKNGADKIIREKRITDAFAKIVNVRIPKIEIVKSGGYTFYKYEFIPGRNLNEFSLRDICQHRAKLGRTLGEFIFLMHGAAPTEIADLATPTARNSDGWNHHDLCNNIIVDSKTMDIAGIIDWEYAGYGPLRVEFENTVAFKEKMRRSNIIIDVMLEYYALRARNKSKKS